MGHRDRGPGNAGARSPLHDLRRGADRRALEDRRTTASPGRRSPTASTPPRSARSRSRRRTRTSSGWARATTPTRARRTRARASSSPPTPARRGSSWGCPTRTTSRASSFIRPIRRSSTSRRMGHLFSRNEERGVFRTRDGGKTLGQGPLRRRRHRRDRPGDEPPVAEHALRGDVREAPDAVAARARRPGQRHPSQRRRRDDVEEGGGTCRRATSGASGSTSAARTRTSSTPSSRTSIPRTEGDGRRASMRAWRSSGRGGGGGATAARAPADRSATRSIAASTAARPGRKTHGDGIDVAGGKAPYSFNQIKTNPGRPGPDPGDQRFDVRVDGRRQDLDTAASCAASSATSGRSGGTSRIRSASCSAATAA